MLIVSFVTFDDAKIGRFWRTIKNFANFYPKLLRQPQPSATNGRQGRESCRKAAPIQDITSK